MVDPEEKELNIEVVDDLKTDWEGGVIVEDDNCVRLVPTKEPGLRLVRRRDVMDMDIAIFVVVEEVMATAAEATAAAAGEDDTETETINDSTPTTVARRLSIETEKRITICCCCLLRTMVVLLDVQFLLLG
mmetsp:Transcript_47919/g.116549  ORF Transcript_47919/g.116549 Transcript_47919/m.116549 type:complete len:131 (+) Transcript_47919:1030-1422(+)